MKKIFIMLIFMIFLFDYAHAKEWKIAERKIEFHYSCDLKNSVILGGLCDFCGRNGEYTRIKFSMEKMKKFENINLIYSWDEFQSLQKGYFQAEFFKKISKDDFKLYIFGVVEVSTAGSEFIKNEKLYTKDGKIFFYYEEWDRDMMAPACIWTKLYIFKLKMKNAEK